MFDLNIVNSLLRDLGIKKKSSKSLAMSLKALQVRIESLERHIDIAINEIEFVRRRTNAYLGEGATLTYLADQSPIFVDPRDMGPAALTLDGRVYEQDNVEVILSFVRPDTVFLDLGANIGMFSLQVGRRLLGTGKVYAFEPQAHLTNLLRRTAFLNGLGAPNGVGRVESHGLGVSDRNGEMGFVFPDQNLGGGRVSENETDLSVSVVRLDDFLGPDFKCDLIKIDVEAHELQALRGMQKILTNSTQVKILFEKLGRDQGYEKDLEDFFDQLNFSIFGVARRATLVPLKRGDLAQWDGYALAGRLGDPDLKELHRRRFFIYPSQLGLGSATIQNGAIKGKGAIGEIIFHGPYWFLPRGQYRMQLHGKLKGGLAITIATRFGYPLTECHFADGATSSEFTIGRDAVFFECVARSETSDMQLSLERVEIIYC